MAMLPCSPTLPRRWRIPRRRQRRRNDPANSIPWSVITVRGEDFACWIARLRKAATSAELGRRLKTAKPTTSLDAWSTATATHQANGQRRSFANGNQGTQALDEMHDEVREAADGRRRPVVTRGKRSTREVLRR